MNFKGEKKHATKKSFALANNPITENDFVNLIAISENGLKITLKE